MGNKDKKTSIANSAQPSQELNLDSNVAIDDYGYSIENGDDDIDARPGEHNEEELGYSTSSSTPKVEKVEGVKTKAERKEERKKELNRIGNNIAAWWNAFNNYEEAKPATTSGGTTTNSETTTGASATTPQGATTNAKVANQVDGASTTTTTTTNGGASTTTDDSNLTPLQKKLAIEANANALRSQRYNEMLKAVGEGQSVYETLVLNSLQRKSNLAERKERDARSRALTNALGTLIGTFTAHGMAKKGGYAPIVNAHDSSADSDYRKSLEQRYALENENENLLMKLEQERRKYEADLAKGNYEQAAKQIDAAAKLRQEAVANEEKFDNQKKLIETKEKVKQKYNTKDDSGDSNDKKDKDEYGTFRAVVNNDRVDKEPHPFMKDQTIDKPHSLSPSESSLLNSVYTTLKGAGLNKKQLKEATQKVRDLWIKDASAFINQWEDEVDKIISDVS